MGSVKGEVRSGKWEGRSEKWEVGREKLKRFFFTNVTSSDSEDSGLYREVFLFVLLSLK